jgi:hypothetical protein
MQQPLPPGKPGGLRVTHETLDQFLVFLATNRGVKLSDFELDAYGATVADLTDDQLTAGATYLNREFKHFPNTAEFRAACTGKPVGGAADTGMAAKIEANRYRSWLGKWAQTLLDGHRYTLTTIPVSGKSPVTNRFTCHSLSEHFWPSPQYGLTELEKQLDAATKALGRFDDVHSKAVVQLSPAGAAAARKRYETEVETTEAKIAKVKALILVDQTDRRYCRMQVEMAPQMPGYLDEILKLLAQPGHPPVEVIQRWVRGDDKYLSHNFQEKALEVIAAHAQLDSPGPARQLPGAVVSHDELRTYRGIVQLDEGKVKYYSPEVLGQTTAVPIDESDIENQAEFVDHLGEIANAPYDPPPPPPKSVTPRDPGITSRDEMLAIVEVRKGYRLLREEYDKLLEEEEKAQRERSAGRIEK